MLSGHWGKDLGGGVNTPSTQIPGSTLNPKRNFIYLEHRGSVEEFLERFEQAASKAWSLGPPSSGGVITENVVLTAVEGRQFFALSYKGDLAAWRRGILAYAAEQGLRTAVVEGPILRLSDGSVCPLESCRVSTYAPTKLSNSVQGGA